MKTVIHWLDEMKDKTGSDYKTAQALGVSRQQVSTFRTGRKLPSVKLCERMAEVLDVNPLEIIASCEVQKDPSEEKHWLKWLPGAAAAFILAGLLTMNNVYFSEGYKSNLNGENIHYAHN